jgi:hypothetical protein
MSVVAALALAAPGAALARGGGGTGGGGGGGGGVVDTVADPACATLDATNANVIDKIGSRKPIELDFNIGNCSRHAETLRTTLVGTGYALMSSDPFVQETCTTAPISAGTITLKPGEKRSFSVSPARCFVNWGINGRDYIYDVTTIDTADGATLATTLSSILNRGGV